MEDGIVVRRLRARYRMAVEPEPSLGAALNRILTEDFAQAVREDASTEGIWLVRHARFKAAIHSGWSTNAIARSLSAQFIAEVDRLVAAGPDGDNVLWFPTRAAYVGRLVSDLASGTASRQWFYSEFEHLMGLSPSSAIVEALSEDPAVGIEAIRGMLPIECSQMLRTIDEIDGLGLLTRLATDDGPHSTDNCAAVVATAIEMGLFEGAAQIRNPELQLYVRLLRSAEHRANASLSICRAVSEAAAVIRGVTPLRRGSLLQAIAAWDAASLSKFPASDVARLAPVLAWPNESRQMFAEALQEPPARDEPGADPEWTRFGGLFLLLPLLFECSKRSVFQALPDVGGVPAVRAVPWLAIAGAFGSQSARAALNDPILRMAMGIPKGLRLHELSELPTAAAIEAALLLRRPPADADLASVELPPDLVPDEASRKALALASCALLFELAWRLPGFSKSSPRFLLENFLDFHATVQDEEERWVVLLENPPLHLVLTMTGMNRREILAPGTGGRPWVLSQRH